VENIKPDANVLIPLKSGLVLGERYDAALEAYNRLNPFEIRAGLGDKAAFK